MKDETRKAIEEFSATAEGWCRTDRALEFASLVLEHRPGVIVELGTFAGGSLIPMALALKELHLAGKGHGKIIGVDPWKKEAALEGETEANKEWWSKSVDLHQMHRLAIEAIWKYELDKYALLVRAASQDCDFLFGEIDILNVDGNHSEEASCRDVKMYLPKVRTGGLIFFDDVDWPTTQKALQMIAEKCDKLLDNGMRRVYRKLPALMTKL